jgi:transposase
MQSVLDVGVDVASRSVVVACAGDSFAPQTLANTPTVLRTWAASLPPGSRLGVEATGGYHEAVVMAAQAARLTVYVLNAREVKRYGQSIGRRGKTDRVDAQVIARYVAREHDQLHPYRAPSAAERRLGELLKRRRKLVTLRESTRQSWRGIDGCAEELRTLLQAYARMLAQIDRLIATTLRDLPQTAARQCQLRAVPGYGPLTSVALAHALGRFPFRNADAFIAYTGLDPRPDDSGSRHGRRRLSKRGPAELRHLLHMSAMAAASLPTWQPYYEAQRAKGLSGTASLVILARKMARTAYAICKTGEAFNAPRAAAAT